MARKTTNGWKMQAGERLLRKLEKGKDGFMFWNVRCTFVWLHAILHLRFFEADGFRHFIYQSVSQSLQYILPVTEVTGSGYLN